MGEKEDYKTLLVKTIEQEYDHNLSQQIFIDEACWNVIVSSKNATTNIIGNTANDSNIETAQEMREEILGTAEVRDVFKSPKFGLVAGCMVVEGSVSRSKQIRVLRENIVIHEGELDSLRRFKDDVSEVRSGTECGIGVKDYTDVKAGDRIEVFDIQKVARSL